ncbi:hypothetical protein MLD38_014724 [Melastoma candidum]|uniref:Uncharacterized protein n=1 Tax=Melastoma candidum TaxID=119954 RepID=A0ACB9RHE5_9MYRT|nr:hypothetical protein MLD38_014724 [Melastoma candidum]
MPRVIPEEPFSVAPRTAAETREIFTVWMKSLIMNGRGCTVFDSNGGIIYRVDNYECGRRSEVVVMNCRGDVVLTLLKKKLSLVESWEGYGSGNLVQSRPVFQVRKPLRLTKGEIPYDIRVQAIGNNGTGRYIMEGIGTGKYSCRISKDTGELIAEAKRKESSTGVMLGKDVLTMVIEPKVDLTIAIGLLIVCGLMNNTL